MLDVKPQVNRVNVLFYIPKIRYSDESTMDYDWDVITIFPSVIVTDYRDLNFIIQLHVPTTHNQGKLYFLYSLSMVRFRQENKTNEFSKRLCFWLLM